LLNEIKSYKITIKGKEIVLRLDFKVLKRMQKLYGNAFELMSEFMTSDNRLEYLPKIIRCMSDEELSEEDIENGIGFSIKNVELLSTIILDLFESEIIDPGVEAEKNVVENLQAGVIGNQGNQ
jgi:hypothetical protein